ncbi:MAG: outer membrane protein assembly factor BamE [Pseudomonadota bacterium]
MRKAILTALAVSLAAACTPSRDFHGYIPDEALPQDIEPGVDTRSTVLARLGSPSTSSIFDDNTWIYMSAARERIAWQRPKVSQRNITAIRFGDDDLVAEVLEYDIDDGQVVNYASRETPTRGRELGFLEQIFGSVGAVRLPVDEENPGGIPGPTRR